MTDVNLLIGNMFNPMESESARVRSLILRAQPFITAACLPSPAVILRLSSRQVEIQPSSRRTGTVRGLYLSPPPH